MKIIEIGNSATEDATALMPVQCGSTSKRSAKPRGDRPERRTSLPCAPR